MLLEYYHYKLSLLNKKIASLSIKTKEGMWIESKGFQNPVTHNKLPKLYIIKNKSEIIYVGIASRSITNRLRDGFAAKGKGGYHGYRWKDLQDDIEILIWCFPGKSLQYVESIEAEVVFAIRNHTGQWPNFQTEIHFHNVTDEEQKLAFLIYTKAMDAR